MSTRQNRLMSVIGQSPVMSTTNQNQTEFAIFSASAVDRGNAPRPRYEQSDHAGIVSLSIWHGTTLLMMSSHPMRMNKPMTSSRSQDHDSLSDCSSFIGNLLLDPLQRHGRLPSRCRWCLVEDNMNAAARQVA